MTGGPKLTEILFKMSGSALHIILNSYDWSGAFDRLDPTEVAVKFIKKGIRSSIVKVVIDFMNGRKMQMKLNQQTSTSHDLTGGRPPGIYVRSIPVYNWK